MKNILIVSALSQELKEIKTEIKKINIKGLKIFYLVSGMGNYNTIFNLTKFLDKNKNIDFIVNIGVCGYKKNIENFIQIGRIKNLSNNKELIIPSFLEFGKIESIACSEKIIYSETEIQEENFVDMESFGFEFVLEKCNLPRIILKVPIDKIGEETKKFDFKKAKKNLRENINYKELLEKILKFLEKNKSEYRDLEKYFKILNLTESQKNIFEKLYNKYEVLVGNDFDNYLDSSSLSIFFKGESKIKIQKNDIKKFLKNLEEFLEDK